jgi:hypothetical protein
VSLVILCGIFAREAGHTPRRCALLISEKKLYEIVSICRVSVLRM